jgi:hypothetical protein
MNFEREKLWNGNGNTPISVDVANPADALKQLVIVPHALEIQDLAWNFVERVAWGRHNVSKR